MQDVHAERVLFLQFLHERPVSLAARTSRITPLENELSRITFLIPDLYAVLVIFPQLTRRNILLKELLC